MGVDLARWVRPFGWASLVANIGIVVTGGAVRLTGSGLGCPTWPRCTEESLTPHGDLTFHAAIEFGNRMLTFVLSAIAIATFVAAWQTGRRVLRRHALVLALGVPAQAVLGGITVLTGLNSWIVSLHLLLSMAMIGVAVLFLRRIDEHVDSLPAATWVRGRLPTLAWITFAAGWVVLYMGTVVTGAGPHAGDAETERNGLDPLQVSQLHADAVFLFVGLTIGLLLASRAAARRAVTVLLVVELSQGAIGFVQYFTDLPELLVGFHLLGAALTSAAMTWAVLAVVLPPAGAVTSRSSARASEAMLVD